VWAQRGRQVLPAGLADAHTCRAAADTLVLRTGSAGDERCNATPSCALRERLAAWLQLPTTRAPRRCVLRRLRETLAGWTGNGCCLSWTAGRDRRPRSAFAVEVPLALAGPGSSGCAPGVGRRLAAAFAGARQPSRWRARHERRRHRSLLLERIGPCASTCCATTGSRRAGRQSVRGAGGAAADGLPLYVHYVIHDISPACIGCWTARAPAAEPGRLSREPVAPAERGQFAAGVDDRVRRRWRCQEPLARRRWPRCCGGGQAGAEGEAGVDWSSTGWPHRHLLKRAPTPEGEDGYTLYHSSLRQQMAAAPEPGCGATAREALADLCWTCTDPAAPYLYRGDRPSAGTARTPEALALLTRFAYLMDRLRALDPTASSASAPTGGRLCNRAGRWRATTGCGSVLARAEHLLPGRRALAGLQILRNWPSSTPIQSDTRRRRLVADGQCDWVWLRNPQRSNTPHRIFV